MSSKTGNEIIENHHCNPNLGQKFIKQMKKWVKINHILSSKICNKNIENDHCKSDFVQKQLLSWNVISFAMKTISRP